MSCGRFKYEFIHGNKPTPAEVAVLQGCMAGAIASKRSFYFSIEGSGVDSYGATGLMKIPNGALQRFSYDSSPCGGPGCAERFEVWTCPMQANTKAIDPFLECSQK